MHWHSEQTTFISLCMIVKQPEVDKMGEEQTRAIISDSSKSHYGFYWFILICSLALICCIPEQAKWVNTNRGWYTQPMVGPLLSLSLLCFFTATRLFLAFRSGSIVISNPIGLLFGAISSYRTALVLGFMFFLYINGIPLLGFFLSTLLFTCTLLWLSRLLDKFWFACSFLTTVMIILIFRVGVSIWLPDVWLYEFLPEAWASFFNQYL